MTESATPTLARLLLVEDEELLRIPTARFLRKQGYEVVEAAHGREALAEIGKGPFDAVLGRRDAGPRRPRALARNSPLRSV